MKKIFTLALASLVALSILVGCSNSATEQDLKTDTDDVVNTSHQFSGVISEVDQNSAIVTPNEGEAILSSGDAVIIALPDTLEVGVGDEVTVVYDGNVMESYPLQVNIISVTKTASSNETENGGISAEHEDTSSPSVAGDATLPKLVIYNGVSYQLTNNDSAIITEEMLGEKIGETSGYIDFTTNFDEKLLSQELANSISDDAVFYKMKDYSEDFRIVVEAGGVYYICENTSIGSLQIAEYADKVLDGEIFNGSGITRYEQITKDDAQKLLDIFAQTIMAELEPENYEAIGQIHKAGKAYMLNINLEDGTFVSFYTLPELNLVSIGQTYYTSETLNDDIAFVFENSTLRKTAIHRHLSVDSCLMVLFTTLVYDKYKDQPLFLVAIILYFFDYLFAKPAKLC